MNDTFQSGHDRSFLRTHWFGAILAACLLLISSGVFYYFAVFLPQDQTQRTLILQEQQKTELEKNQLLQAEQLNQQDAEAAKNQLLQDQQLHQQEANRAAAERAAAKEQANQQSLYQCLDNAHQQYNAAGNKYCHDLGYTDEQINNLQCTLAFGISDRLLKEQEDAQKFCVTLYKK